MSWETIADLPENWPTLVSTEVDSLAEAWETTYQTLKDTTTVQIFNERLRREWSIETGIIERLYTIDEGTTRLLIEQGIDAALITSGSTNRPAGEVIQIIKAQREALDGLYDFIARDGSLSVHYIRTLHQVLLKNEKYVEAVDQLGNIGITPLIKGDWRKQPSRTERFDGTLSEYCSPEQIQSEMDRLVQLHQVHMAQGVSPQVEAAWLHHRFTQIHPFQDGNGRMARSLATLVLLKARRFPLVVRRGQRNEYLEALKEADAGELSQLVRFFDLIEKRAYIQALDLSEDVLHTRETVFELVDTIAAKYRERQQTRYDRVFDVALLLRDTAQRLFEDYAVQIQQRFQRIGIPIATRVTISNDENIYWYQSDIIDTAKDLGGYFVNLTRPRLWVRLRLKDESRITPADAEIVVSLHYLGKENRGVMIATAFLNILHVPDDAGKVEDELADTRGFRETHTIVTDGFTFAHTDTGRSEQRKREFREWLEQAVAVGLAEWQKQL